MRRKWLISEVHRVQGLSALSRRDYIEIIKATRRTLEEVSNDDTVIIDRSCATRVVLLSGSRDVKCPLEMNSEQNPSDHFKVEEHLKAEFTKNSF